MNSASAGLRLLAVAFLLLREIPACSPFPHVSAPGASWLESCWPAWAPRSSCSTWVIALAAQNDRRQREGGRGGREDRGRIEKKNPFVITGINKSREEMQMPCVVNYMTEEVTAFY